MLWSLGKTLSMEQRLEMVAAAGYNGGELVTEWRTWSNDERSRIVAKKNSLGLTFDLMFPSNAPLTDPAARTKLADDIKQTILIAREIGCPQFGLKSGPPMPGRSPEQQRADIADGLKLAGELCGEAGMELLLEPIDLLEDKHSAVYSVSDGFEIIRAVDNPKVKVLYDFYHEQRGAGNLIEKLQNNIDLVGLVHIADVPGRHHPGTGEMNYTTIYRKLADLHYARYVTMEFIPLGDPVAELKIARQEALTAMSAT